MTVRASLRRVGSGSRCCLALMLLWLGGLSVACGGSQQPTSSASAGATDTAEVDAEAANADGVPAEPPTTPEPPTPAPSPAAELPADQPMLPRGNTSGPTADSSPSGRQPAIPGPKGSAAERDAARAADKIRELRARFLALQARFRQCYNKALAANPELTGRFYFDLKFDASGGITSAKANDQTTPNLRGTELERCLVKVLMNFSTPATGKPVVFTMPIILESLAPPKTLPNP